MSEITDILYLQSASVLSIGYDYHWQYVSIIFALLQSCSISYELSAALIIVKFISVNILDSIHENPKDCGKVCVIIFCLQAMISTTLAGIKLHKTVNTPLTYFVSNSFSHLFAVADWSRL